MLDRTLGRRARRARKQQPTAEWTLDATPAHHLLDEDPSGSVIYVGRAPVFDRRGGVAGFHLLVDELDGTAPGDRRWAPGSDGRRSRQILTRALLEVGLDSLIGGRLGFVEVPLDVLAGGAHLALPPHRMVFEVSGAIDAEGLGILREVRDEGYRVLLAEPERAHHPEAALRFCAGALVDGSRPDAEASLARVMDWAPRAQVLVHGVADEAAARIRGAGATWVRGDLLRPPEQVDEPTIPLQRLTVLQLISELERPDVDFDDIDRLISIDLGMSYKLLRMANSSYLALERRVERTRDAIVYLGIDTVRAAAALLALSEATDHPPEIVHLSLVRARHCEELVRDRYPELAHAAFTTGLFSTLDTLLGLSMDQILLRIPVADHIAGALRERDGVLGMVLEVVTAYERGDLARLTKLGADPSSTVLGYRRALAWMNEMLHGLEGSPSGSR